MKSYSIAIAASPLAGISALALMLAAQEPPKIVEPPSLPLAEVRELDPNELVRYLDQQISLHCNVCHSMEMIEQQKLTLPQWKAEVVKMVGWGATLPKDSEDVLAEHLHKKFLPDHTPAPPWIEPRLALKESHQADQAAVSVAERNTPATAELYARQCANCHGPEGHGNDIGPRLTGRPSLTRPEQFLDLVIGGRNRMPSFGATLKNDELNALRRWLLGRTVSWSE
jgi:mono/diheme cytochrome c family protein